MADFGCAKGSVFSLAAGPHDRSDVIMSLACGECSCSGYHLLEQLDAQDQVVAQIPAQCSGDEDECCGCHMSFIVPTMKAGETLRFRVAEAPEFGENQKVTIEPAQAQYDFKIGGDLYTSYRIGADLPRPFCFPVLGPQGKGVTICPDEEIDRWHPHHRSMYTAHGEINGHDNWSEAENHAKTVNQECFIIAQGPVYAELLALNDWETSDGKKLLAETTAIRVYNLSGSTRVMDWDITWTAAYGGVFFGDTKEAGNLSVRIPQSMDGVHGGRMVNGYGAVGEAECWGQPAPWVDYVGPVEGVELGLAIFDHPTNFRYPTEWHVRDYGLFTANPWGLHHYSNDWSMRGDYSLQEGDSLHWLFRVYLHEGDTQSADVATQWLSFAYPPKLAD